MMRYITLRFTGIGCLRDDDCSVHLADAVAILLGSAIRRFFRPPFRRMHQVVPRASYEAIT
jgi:hypothetical protein